MASRREIEEAFAGICEVFPAPPGETTETLPRILRVWMAVLADLPPPALAAAVLDVLASAREFRPSPGVIRQRAFDLMQPKRLSSIEAWGLVERGIQDDKRPRGDLRVSRLVEQFGWWELRESRSPGRDREQFMRAYDELIRAEEQQRRMLPEVRKVRDFLVAVVESGRDEPPAKLVAMAASIGKTMPERGGEE